MDPRQFNNDADLATAYKTGWAFAQASDQIMAFVQRLIEDSDGLTKKEKDEGKDLLREAVS